MLDVIIVGASGKAGLLHYNSYKKIKDDIKIYLVDINAPSKIKNDKIYKSIYDVIKLNNLDINKIIVDICTPKEEFIKIIGDAYNIGIRNILVEKPFIVNEKFFTKYKDLNIVMVENYLFSIITEDIKTKIKLEDIRKIHCNFSKNRINESLNSRGISNKVTLNYEIEIPHLIYLISNIIGYGNIFDLCTTIKDMKCNNIILKKHGYGKIEFNKNNIEIIYESNLMDKTTTKEIDIYLINGKKLIANYIIYDNNLNIKKPGSIRIYNGDILEYIKTYFEDDNFYKFIENTYYNFVNKKVGDKEKEEIIKFSEEMQLFIDMVD